MGTAPSRTCSGVAGVEDGRSSSTATPRASSPGVMAEVHPTSSTPPRASSELAVAGRD